MRERIWYELCQAKHNTVYVTGLLVKSRKNSKLVSIFLLVFSGTGVLGWKIWETLPFVSCILVAFISLMQMVLPNLVPGEKQIEKLDSISDFYSNYLNSLERLWLDYEDGEVTETQAKDVFFEIKGSQNKINSSVNEVTSFDDKSLIKKAAREATSYLNKIYFHEQ